MSFAVILRVETYSKAVNVTILAKSVKKFYFHVINENSPPFHENYKENKG